jgi:hypothetical protein
LVAVPEAALVREALPAVLFGAAFTAALGFVFVFFAAAAVVAALFRPLAAVVNLAGFVVGMMLVTSSCRSETGKVHERTIDLATGAAADKPPSSDFHNT